MHAQFGTYSGNHSDTIVCPNCGKCGSIMWDEVHGMSGDSKELIGITGEFYERLCKKSPYSIELVCYSCGTALPGQGL